MALCRKRAFYRVAKLSGWVRSRPREPDEMLRRSAAGIVSRWRQLASTRLDPQRQLLVPVMKTVVTMVQVSVVEPHIGKGHKCRGNFGERLSFCF